jgi:hypothetical protein
MTATAGLFIVDFIMRPFAKIFEKMPCLMMLLLLLLYGLVGYTVFKSAYAEHGN